MKFIQGPQTSTTAQAKVFFKWPNEGFPAILFHMLGPGHIIAGKGAHMKNENWALASGGTRDWMIDEV